jgi:hypothetical protein
MRRKVVAPLLCLFAALRLGHAIPPPTGLIRIAGDKSVVLHWDRVSDPALSGYHVYRSTSGAAGPFSLAGAGVLTGPGFCDISGSVLNGRTNFYFVRAVATNSVESAPSSTNAALPHVFVSDDEFLDYVQQTCFFYFWYAANPTNGLVPDRSAPGSACSIAAVGFGLTAIGIAADHGWITRTQAVTRVLTTLNTFWQGPQGPATTGVIGYNGWFYHFLDMNTALRAGSELSSIDTCLLLAGILYAKQYFNGPGASEASIRSLADAIFNRVNWTFMSQGTNAVRMGWDPATGFQNYGNWVGYNEGMIIYLLGLGTATNPLPASSWSTWTSGYTYGTFYGQTYVPFPSLFGHEYSHCWVDYRFMADTYMNSNNLTYFENSRRAALAEVAYCGAGPHVGYSTNVWGLTACDGPPPTGYAARGLPPALDDGTIAPTAPGGAICFAPEYCLPTLEYLYSHFRINIWTEYGYRDAFNIGQGWYDSDELGIDQGPIVIMIENYRSQNVWNLFRLNAEVQRGLQRAGFVRLPFMALSPQSVPSQGTFSLTWTASASRYYQVEYSPDLFNWFFVPGFVQATNSGPFTWFDTGPPATASLPVATPQRFFRVFQLGSP